MNESSPHIPLKYKKKLLNFGMLFF